jgi:hypothetical protein
MQHAGSRIITTGSPTRVLIEVAYQESKILLSVPKTSFKAASIFSAGYMPSAKYDFKSSCTRDRKGISRTFRRLKASFAKCFCRFFKGPAIEEHGHDDQATWKWSVWDYPELTNSDSPELIPNATLKNLYSGMDSPMRSSIRFMNFKSMTPRAPPPSMHRTPTPAVGGWIFTVNS